MLNKLWVLILLIFMGCGLEEFSVNPNERYVNINVEPKDSRVVIKSMSNSQITTLTPPYSFHYVLLPYQATYVEVSHKGYRRKIIKLDGSEDYLDVKLEKLSETEIMMQKYKTNAAGRAGPSLDAVPGSGMGGGGVTGAMGR